MHTSTQFTTHQTFKRVKERNVAEAIEKVELWRSMFDDGIKASDGTIYRVTLNKAAEIVGIPKKTLEDYTQLFKKVGYLTDVKKFANEKMGYLRSYLRKNQTKLKKILKEIRIQELEQQKKAQLLIDEQKQMIQQIQNFNSINTQTIQQDNYQQEHQVIKQTQVLEEKNLNETVIRFQTISNDFEISEDESHNFYDYDSNYFQFGLRIKSYDTNSIDYHFQSTDESL